MKGPLSRLAWFAALLGLAPACASVGPLSPAARTDQLQTAEATFVIQYEPEDAKAAQDVRLVLAATLPLLKRWGAFSAPVTIRLQPSHEALERAIRHYNYPWLRAWARYDSIDLQSPRTWSVMSAPLGQVAEVLTHELTHCLMYQRAGSESTWEYKDIPLWFREGMASVTSHQEYRRPGDEAIWKYLQSNPSKDPVLDGERLYQAEPEIVYGAAHDAFAFLDRRYGDDTVNAILTGMGAGEDFGPAFVRAVGLDQDAFSREYLRYVKWEGWRSVPDARVAFPLVPRPH